MSLPPCRTLPDVPPLARAFRHADEAPGGLGVRVIAVDAEPARRAACAIDEVTSQRSRWYRENRRPRALTAREALVGLHFECLLVWAYGKSLLQGREPTEDEEARVTIAMQRIEELTAEAIQ